jgi:hypothetical protein
MRFLVRQLHTVDELVPTASATAAVPPSSLMIASTDIGRLYFTDCEDVNLHRLAGEGVHDLWIIAHMGTSKTAVGRRLIAFHAAEQISQAEVCRAIGIKENRYSQYLSGDRKLPVEIALRLKATYGLTTDWIYGNDVSGLPAKLHHKLAQVAAA